MQKEAPKKENSLVNLLLNIVVPVLILTKADKLGLDPLSALIIAILFPLSYGVYNLVVQKKTNFISILGVVSVLLTGLIGVFEFPTKWVAIKEASIPFLIGAVVLVSGFTKFPLATKLLYNKELFDLNRIDEALNQEGRQTMEGILKKVSIYFSLSFFLSAILNYALAKYLVHSDPGTVAFNEELGKMTLYSFPVIVAPSLIVVMAIFWYFIKSIRRLTGLSQEEIFAIKPKTK